MQLLTTRWTVLSPSLSSSRCPWPTPPAYMLSMMPYGMAYPFGQLGSAALAVSPPSFLYTGQPSRRSWEVLDDLATTKNISMFSTLFSSQIQSTALQQLLGGKLTPSQLKPGQYSVYCAADPQVNVESWAV